MLQKGYAFHLQGKFNDALKVYKSLLKIQPYNFDALQFIAILYIDLNKVPQAIEIFKQILKIYPNHVDTFNNLGNALQEISHLDEALIYYERAISIKPNDPSAFSNRGVLLYKQKKLAAALSSYQYAIDLDPNDPELYNNYGVALQELYRYEESLFYFNKAIKLNATYFEAFSNRGVVLRELGLLNEAIFSYKSALKINPEYIEAQWNLALCNLLIGNYSDGWRGYELRWKRGASGLEKKVIPTSPQWYGKDNLQDKTIFIYAEQGLGDTIQFSRYISLLSSLGAKVILEAQVPLIPLLRSIEGVHEIISPSDCLPKSDFHSPLLSLPLAFNTALNSIPTFDSYLKTPKDKVTLWSEKLGLKHNLRVGLAWSSVSNFSDDGKRSISLETFLSALPSEGFEYVCLQKEIKLADQYLMNSNHQIKFFGSDLHDFTDTAALIDCMDLIVSTCTCIPHLSGSLGKETWLLVSKIPDWRWLLDREDSPWYPKLKLFRQTVLLDWTNVLLSVKSNLETFHKRWHSPDLVDM